MTRNLARSTSIACASVLAVLTISGLAMCLLGGSPALLVVTVLVSAVGALGPRIGWTLSLPIALVGLLVVSIAVVRIAPLLGFDLSAGTLLGLFLIGLTASCAIGVSRSPATPSGAVLTVAVAALVVPIGFLVSMAIAIGLGDDMRVGWAMNNDAVWNTVSARLILADGGIAPWSTPNPSPLANGLMALWYAPGRPDAGGLLRHDVSRQSELLLLMITLCSALCGLVTARAVGGRRRLVVISAGVLGGIIPLTWLMAGYVIQFGFFNVVPVVAVLLAAWLLWSEAGRRPAVAVPGLVFAAVVLLAAWAPAAALPIALAGVAVVRFWRRPEMTPARLVGPVLGAATLGAYVLLVTLPDLQRSGHALAANGAAPPSHPLRVVLAAAVVFVIVVVGGVIRSRYDDALGVAVVIVVSGAVIAYLVWQRLGQPSPWGYYPAKFAWIVCIVLAVIGAAAALTWAGQHRARSWRSVPVAVAAGCVAVATMIAVPPPAKTIPGMVPVAALFDQMIAASADGRAEVLFDLSDGERTIAARLSPDPLDDSFANLWLLQLFSVSSDEAIRAHAYLIDSGDAADICSAAETWGTPVRVVTSDDALPADLSAECGGLPISVEVRNRADSRPSPVS